MWWKPFLVAIGTPRPLPQSPLVFPALSLAFFFARAPLSERLEQAIFRGEISRVGRQEIATFRFGSQIRSFV